MFNRNGLTGFLSYAKTIAPIIRFKNIQYHDTGIVLRHDVDFNTKAAFEVAELEVSLGLRSTFFVLLNHYPADLELLNYLVLNDFEIGLHYDPLVDGLVDNEVNNLEQLTGQKVYSVSVHNPSVHGIYPEFDGYINTYDGFNNETYISDSLMNFRSKDPYVFLDRAKESLIQVVLHPVYYSSLRS